MPYIFLLVAFLAAVRFVLFFFSSEIVHSVSCFDRRGKGPRQLLHAHITGSWVKRTALGKRCSQSCVGGLFFLGELNRALAGPLMMIFGLLLFLYVFQTSYLYLRYAAGPNV